VRPWFLAVAVRAQDRYHFVVPSLPGWTYSSPPPLDQDFAIKDVSYLIHGLMRGLGFNKYVAQGGDIGSMVSVDLAVRYKECTGTSMRRLHLHTSESEQAPPRLTHSPPPQLPTHAVAPEGHTRGGGPGGRRWTERRAGPRRVPAICIRVGARDKTVYDRDRRRVQSGIAVVLVSRAERPNPTKGKSSRQSV